MKKLITSGLFLTALFFASCAADSKDDPNSPAPSTDVRDKFVSYWSASEHSALIGGTTSHTVNISKSTSLSSDILIANFYGLPSSNVRATVSNSSFIIPYQQVSGGFVIGGSGTLSGSAINLTYTTAIGTDRDSCTTTYSK